MSPLSIRKRREAFSLLLTPCLALVLWGSAQAHDDAYLDTVKAPHGGQLRMAGPLHLELVLSKDATNDKDSLVQVYVTDHAGQPRSTQGAAGSITILSGKTKSTAVLQADGDNRLKGSARYAASADLKAIVSVTLMGQAVQQARFTPFAGTPAAEAHSHQH